MEVNNELIYNRWFLGEKDPANYVPYSKEKSPNFTDYCNPSNVYIPLAEFIRLGLFREYILFQQGNSLELSHVRPKIVRVNAQGTPLVPVVTGESLSAMLWAAILVKLEEQNA